MNRYQQPNFRPAFGIAAAAMTVITIAIAVVLPATLAGAAVAETTLAAAKPAASGAVIVLSPIEVVGTRATAANTASPARAG